MNDLVEMWASGRSSTAARKVIVVVGCSYSGTELIAQLCAMAAVAVHDFGFQPGDVRLILVERSGRLMPELGPELAARAELTNTLFARPLVSIGFAQSSLARFSASEEFIPASAVMHPSDQQMYADDLRYQKASADPTTVPSHSD
jgi:hypothetical protein